MGAGGRGRGDIMPEMGLFVKCGWVHPPRDQGWLPTIKKSKFKIPYQYHFFYQNPQKNQKSGKYHSNSGKFSSLPVTL